MTKITGKNMAKRLSKASLFSSHVIEIIDDLRCPLIEG